MSKPSFSTRLFYTRWIFGIMSAIMQYISAELFFAGNMVWEFYAWLYKRNFDANTRQSYVHKSNDEGVDWENPRVVSRGKRPGHTVLRSFVSAEHSLTFWKNGGKPSNTAKHCNIYFLTGQVGTPDITRSWKFALVGSPEAAPSGWEKSSYPLADTWTDMALPSHWQCQGFDIPIYTNTAYPFRFDPPRARRDGKWLQTDCDAFLGGTAADTTINDAVGENATGLYRKTFTLPSDWTVDQSLSKWRYFLVFEGVDAALEVWVDGVYKGYSQDSCLPAEFDITDLLSREDGVAEHLLCCRVMRWCDGSYIEDQDKWWLSGIYREVYIMRKRNDAMIADYEVTTSVQWESEEDGSVTTSAATAVGARMMVEVQVEQLTEGSMLTGDDGEGALEVKVEFYEAQQVSFIDNPPGADSKNFLAQKSSRTAEPILVLTRPISMPSHDSPRRQLSGRSRADAIADAAQAEVTSLDPATCTSSRYSCSVVTLEGEFKDPRLWSAEVPTLYTMIITLQHSKTVGSGAAVAVEIDVEGCRVGIREVSIGGPHNQLRVNRRAITVAGVNRHEFDCYNGRAVSDETMQLDAALMKQLNFNAVRLSHYPHHHRWLEICDAAGLYVIDEANIESHGFQLAGQPVGYLSSLPEWLGAHLSRAARMFERDKNFSSIIGWSLGNESGIGGAHHTMYAWLKAREPAGRFVQYEAGGARSAVTDVICPMYLRPEWCIKQALSDSKSRPVILCEYAHAMGNSAGGLADYWDKFWSPDYPRLQGGFIWDFVDQGLVLGKRAGCFGYGGDFGDIPNSRHFCINGILGPNRVPHPIAREAAALQCPLSCSLVIDADSCEGKGSMDHCRVRRVCLLVQNRLSFSTLSHLVLQLSLGCDSAPVDDDFYTTTIAMKDVPRIDPGCREEIDVTFAWPDLLSCLTRRRDLLIDINDTGLPISGTPTEAWLAVRACVGADFGTEYLPSNHALCCVTLQHQALLPAIREMLTANPDADCCDIPSDHGWCPRDSLSMSHSVLATGDVVVEWGSGNTALVGGECGRLLSWAVSGRELLSSPMDMCLWRAPTDNDKGGAALSYYQQWLAAGLNRLHRKPGSISVSVLPPNPDSVSISAQWHLISPDDSAVAADIPTSIVYTFSATGTLEVNFSVFLPPSIPPPPRVGLRMALCNSLSEVNWLGLGPHEAYDDRCAGVQLGEFSMGVEELHVPYVMPQECGRRQSPRWIYFFDSVKNSGLRIKPMLSTDDMGTGYQCSSWGWSASRYSLETLESTSHNHELEADPNGQIHVHVDRRMMGIGGYDSWSPNVKQQYMISTNQKVEGTLLFCPTSSTAR